LSTPAIVQKNRSPVTHFWLLRQDINDNNEMNPLNVTLLKTH